MDILLNEISVQSGKKPPNDYVSRVPWVPEVGVEIGRGFVEKKTNRLLQVDFFGWIFIFATFASSENHSENPQDWELVYRIHWFSRLDRWQQNISSVFVWQGHDIQTHPFGLSFSLVKWDGTQQTYTSFCFQCSFCLVGPQRQDTSATSWKLALVNW